MLIESHDKGEIVTGLFYVDPKRPNFIDLLNVMDEPLATLPESKVRPPKEVLDQVMQSLM
jgi:2-oxoglutarate ferredoxin oxidoreductase subunit beta